MAWFAENREFEMGFQRKSPSYYNVLGVSEDASVGEIRSAYRKLAMQWHPDKWTRSPLFAGEAKQRFQQIQEAYTVLSNEGKRSMYDAGLYDPTDEEDEGFSDFVQEMVSLMANVRKEGKCYSLEELQQMLLEMAKNDQEASSTPWLEMGGAGCLFGSQVLESSVRSKRARRESATVKRNSHPHVRMSGLSMFGSPAFVI